jgi:hypothetical protein
LQTPSFAATTEKRNTWQTAQIKINEFRNAEVPTEGPISFASFSIGEEISESEALTVKWSPAGLGEHNSCALTVLTSNLVLSLWSAFQFSSWRRSFILNHALALHFQKIYPDEDIIAFGDRTEHLKRFQRVRCFCWAPKPPPVSDRSGKGDSTRFLIAVANDEGQLLILNVSSPFIGSPSSSHSWEASVLAHFELEDDLDLQRPTLFWTFEDYMLKNSSAEQITWSPWFLRDEQYVSFIAYSIHHEVVCRRVIWSGDKSRPGLEIDQFRIHLPMAEGQIFRGALHFDTVVHRRKVSLVYQTHHEITCCSISTERLHKYGVYHYGMDSWDELAGILSSDLTTDSY